MDVTRTFDEVFKHGEDESGHDRPTWATVVCSGRAATEEHNSAVKEG